MKYMGRLREFWNRIGFFTMGATSLGLHAIQGTMPPWLNQQTYSADELNRLNTPEHQHDWNWKVEKNGKRTCYCGASLIPIPSQYAQPSPQQYPQSYPPVYPQQYPQEYTQMYMPKIVLRKMTVEKTPAGQIVKMTMEEFYES